MEEEMLKHIGLASFLVLLLGTSLFGQSTVTVEPYEMASREIKKGDYELWGCFDKPCSVDPGQINLFGFSSSVSIVGYHFIGWTGDKTFDILKSETDKSTRPWKEERKIYHLYFGTK